MNIIVCVKRVPQVQDVDLEIDSSKKDIQKGNLPYFINEWDNYAVEEAVRLKERLGGTVTAITLGDEDDEEVLRRCLAFGADNAIRVDPGSLVLDSYVISRILSEVIKDLDYDLILTGVQADDLNSGMVGIMLAEHLGIAHSAVVTDIEVLEGTAAVEIELEDGLVEKARIRFPALLTIQTGINEPRYVSVMGIKKASRKEIDVKGVDDLNLSQDDLTPATLIEEISLPPETGAGEILEGDPSAIADQIIEIIKEKGAI
jgi:electron transfer flavoprotein beta subunit